MNEKIVENGLVYSKDKTILYGPKSAKTCPVIIELPDTVKIIEENAFHGCERLMKIKLNNGLEKIKDSAFSRTSIEKIDIPKSVKFIGDYALNCEVVVEKGNKVYETDGRCLYMNKKGVKTLCYCFKAGITSYTVMPETKEIAEYAFAVCDRLHKISLPESLEKIGINAFGSKLDELFIPKNVFELGDNQLEYLHNNIFHDGFTGYYYTSTPIQFDAENPYFGSTKEYIFQKTTAGNILLRMQETVSHLEIPEGFIEIADNAFKEQKKLLSIVLPKSLQKIGEGAFQNCEKLESIEFPFELSKIGRFSFSSCAKLRSLVFNSGDVEIDDSAFVHCNIPLISVVYPENTKVAEYVKKVGFSVIEEADDSKIKFDYKILKDGTAKITGYPGNAKIVTIPNEIDGHKVLEIHKDTFRNNENIMKIIWNTSMEAIPDECFYGCKTLKEIEFQDMPNLVIGKKAFYNCLELKKVEIPNFVSEISDDSFGFTKNVYGTWKKGQCIETILGFTNSFAQEFASRKGIAFIDLSLSEEERELAEQIQYHVVDDGVSLDKYDVENLDDELIIPEQIDGKEVVELGEFFNAKSCVKNGNPVKEYENLPKKVRISKNLKRISCRLNGRGIEELTIDKDNKSIKVDECAWYEESILVGCWKSGAKKYSVKDGTETIKQKFLDAMYFYCEEYTIPLSVTNIEVDQKWYGNTQIQDKTVFGKKDSYIESVAEKYDFVFVDIDSDDPFIMKDDNLVKYVGKDAIINIPSHVKHIGLSAFENNEFVKEVTIPEGVKDIGNCAFSDCLNLEYVEIPSTVEQICGDAFTNDSNLKDVIFNEGIIRIDDIFKNCSNLGNIVLPDSVSYLYGAVVFGTSEKMHVFKAPGVTSISSEFSVGCKLRLEPIVAIFPRLRLGSLKDASDKMWYAFGYCAEPDAYSGDIAEEYAKYVKSQKKRIIAAAEEAGFTEVLDYYKNLGLY